MQATIFDGTDFAPFNSTMANSTTTKTPFEWIDILATGANDAGAATMLKDLGFDDQTIRFALRTNVAGIFRPIGDNFLGTTWLAGEGVTTPPEMHYSWNGHRFVTVRFGGDAAMTELRREVKVRASSLVKHPDTAPIIILQLVLAGVRRQISQLSIDVDGIDQDIIEGPKAAQLDQLRQVRACMLPLSRRMPGYSEAIDEALIAPDSLPGIDASVTSEVQAYSTDLKDAVAAIGDLSDSMRNAVQDYQTEVSNKQGNRINQLTVVSIVFLPITFITGYFGMNFNWLDNELQSMVSWLLLGVLVPIVMVIWSIVALGKRGYFNRRRNRESERTANSIPAPSGSPPMDTH